MQVNKKIIISKKYSLKYTYYALDNGNIYSEKTHHILSKHLDKDGYEKVRLITEDGRHTFSVHRLILESFHPIPNMESMQVNHIDGNKQNNSLNNLEWCTCSENIHHAYKIGLSNQKGEKNNASKLTEKEVKEIIQLLLSKKYTLKEIGNKYNVCADAIGAIKNKHNWFYLTKDIDFN